MKLKNELYKKHEKEFNNFPLLFAFGSRQFNSMLKKHNLQVDDVVSIDNGGYIRKTDLASFRGLLAQHERERAAID